MDGRGGMDGRGRPRGEWEEEEGRVKRKVGTGWEYWGRGRCSGGGRRWRECGYWSDDIFDFFKLCSLLFWIVL